MAKQKENRFEAIRKLILEYKINNQAELLEFMKSKGFDVTQATLSRDIKQLKVIKTPDEKGDYFYQIPDRNIYAKKSVNASPVPFIEFSDTLAVMKTSPGYAMGIASDIDQSAAEGIMGTIAGDDTILLILRKGFDKKQIINALSRIAPSIREIIK
jgi:Arginine repressor